MTPAESSVVDARLAVLDLLRVHGWNATSFQVLERGFSYWFDPEADACVAYVDTGHACALSVLEVLADAVRRARGPLDAALAHGRRVPRPRARHLAPLGLARASPAGGLTSPAEQRAVVVLRHGYGRLRA